MVSANQHKVLLTGSKGSTNQYKVSANQVDVLRLPNPAAVNLLAMLYKAHYFMFLLTSLWFLPTQGSINRF